MTAQDTACEKRVDMLESEMKSEMENATSESERQSIQEEYERKISKVIESCESQERDKGQREPDRIDPKKAPDVIPPEKCRERAEEIKSELISGVRNNGLMKLQRPIEQFFSERSKLAAKCKIYSSGETDLGAEKPYRDSPERPKPRKPVKDMEEPVREFTVSYDLPDNIGEECSSEIKSIKQRYRKRIRENPEKRPELRKELGNEIERKLEKCHSGPKILNLSEAPAMMTESCKKKMRQLNQRIKSNTAATVGDQVPEKYRQKYQSQIENCMKVAVANKVKKGVLEKVKKSADNLLGGPGKESLKEKLEKKQKRIEELEAKLETIREDREKDKSGKQQRPEEDQNPSQSRQGEENVGEQQKERERTGSRKTSQGIVSGIIGSIFG